MLIFCVSIQNNKYILLSNLDTNVKSSSVEETYTKIHTFMNSI